MELSQGLVEALLKFLATEVAKPELPAPEAAVVEMAFRLLESLDASDGLYPPQLVAPTVAFLRSIVGVTKLPMGVRASAAQLIVTFVESSGGLLARDAKLIDELLTTVTTLCLDPTPEPEEKK
jgi:hypothetical protein